MAAQTADAFRKAVTMMRLLKSSTVVVGLSGSSDSVALAYLAKQTFTKVLTMTVNLNMGQECAVRAEKVGEIARDLGVEHSVVTLDWDEGEWRRKTEAVARHRRYPALMEQCRRVGARILMMAHSQDDQMETMVYRLSKSSGIEGLAGMPPLSSWANYPDISIARPFLDCSRLSLEQMCREENLPSIARGDTTSERGVFKSVPRKYDDLREGLLELMSLCREARDIVQPQVAHTVKKLPAINTQLGTLSFPISTFTSLNPAIGRRALGLWIRYIGGVSDIRYDLIIPMYRLIHTAQQQSNTTGSNIIVTVDYKHKRVVLSRRSPDSKYRVKVPIRVGETIFWDNRFKISLIPRNATSGKEEEISIDKDSVNQSFEEPPVFYVRHLIERDWPLMSKGVVRHKIPVWVRGGLPVVVDDQNKIVLMPHFKVASREANIVASVKFKPVRSIDDILQYSHYHEC